MFRHKTAVTNEEKSGKKGKEQLKEEVEEKTLEVEEPVEKEGTAESSASVKELLEKNLKWSQIIYEQNRKINNKLLWTAVGSWIKVFLILIPLILAGIIIAPMAKNLSAIYSDLLSGGVPSTNSTESLNQMMKLLPLNSAQQEQLKAILK